VGAKKTVSILRFRERSLGIRTKGRFISWDWNARVQEPVGDEEKAIVGRHTFHKDSANALGQREEVWQNRMKLIDFCKMNHLRLENTWFMKTDAKLVTYRAPGTQIGSQLRRHDYEQLDFVVVPRRWKNSVTNVESDTQANINSDHYPLTIDIKAKLKAIQNGGKMRCRCDKRSPEEK